MNYGNTRSSRPWYRHSRQKAFLYAFMLAAFSLLDLRPAQAQRGALTMPRNLTELSSKADRIIQGRVVAARVEPHPDYHNLKTILITLEVEDALKGGASKTFTFRQFIWDIRDASDIAGYRIGDEVLLFMNRPTSLGLSSPVGLEQGRFRITKDHNGESVALNGSGNAGLMNSVVESGALTISKLSPRSRTSIQSYKQGAISLSALKESVHMLLQNQMGAR
jgi:hypothetical protein